jgi:nucleoside-diphosphate-sugar epimerase
LTIFTIFGADGFIGRSLVTHLRRIGRGVQAVGRDSPLPSGSLGHVIYAIGLTADFRNRPFETIDAHVSLLARYLSALNFKSFTYLSSTRVYDGVPSTSETAFLAVNPANPSHLYNLSKLTGEALCLVLDRPEVRVARLSNVYGVDHGSSNFLNDIIRSALEGGRVEMRTALASNKDYISIDLVCDLVARIALDEKERIYNVASGRNTRHHDIMEIVRAETGCIVDVAKDAPVTEFPPIDVQRLRRDFPHTPSYLTADLPHLIAGFRKGPTTC